MTIAIRTCLAVGLAVAVIGPAAASDRGSEQDQMACTPDVYRLCASQIPDEDAIVTCLRAHKASLSADCAKVFSSPAPGKSTPDDD